MHKLNFLHIKYIKNHFFLFLLILTFFLKKRYFQAPFVSLCSINKDSLIIRKGSSLRKNFPRKRDLLLKELNGITHPTSNNEIEVLIKMLYSFNEEEITNVVNIIRKDMGIRLVGSGHIPLLSISREQIKNVIENPLFLDFLKKNIEDRRLSFELKYKLMSLKWHLRLVESFRLFSLLPLLVKDLTLLSKDEQKFFLVFMGIRIDLIIENRFLELKDSPLEILQLLNLIQSFIENRKLSSEVKVEIFIAKWKIFLAKWRIIMPLFKLKSNLPKKVLVLDKLHASLRDFSIDSKFFDAEIQGRKIQDFLMIEVFGLMIQVIVNWTPEQIQEMVEIPSISNPIQNFIEDKGLNPSIREGLWLMKWLTIFSFKKSKPKALDPVKLGALLSRDLSRFNVETQEILIRKISKELNPEEAQEFMNLLKVEKNQPPN